MPPPQPPTPQLENLNPNAEKIAISAAPVETDIEMSGGFSLGVGEGEHINRAQVTNSFSGLALSGEATATVRVVKDDIATGDRIAKQFYGWFGDRTRRASA